MSSRGNLSCQHCRAVPQRRPGPSELTTSRAFNLIDQIAQVATPVFVLSGGEPLFRPDCRARAYEATGSLLAEERSVRIGRISTMLGTRHAIAESRAG